MRILIADDAADSRLILQRLLKKWGHEVLVAEDGAEAWQILEKDPVSFVITDWMMPHMDGAELCRRIRGSKRPNYVYVILLTAKDGKGDLVEGMECGADDFLNKPFDRGELQVRIRAGERILRLEKRLEDRNNELQETNLNLGRAYKRIEKDLQATADMQRRLLPDKDKEVPGVNFSWLFTPSTFVGGDIFNFFMLDKGKLGFYHLDVSGHGVPSAMLSVTLSKVLSPDPAQGSFLLGVGEGVSSRDVTPPNEVVAELNRRFQNDESMLYFTMVYGVLDLLTGKLEFTQAGHPCPVHLRKGFPPALLGNGGYPVGMLPDVEYDLKVTNIEIGEKLLLYSDGISECKNDAREEYGEGRILELVAGESAGPIDHLTALLEKDLRQWRGDKQYDDDISLLVIERSC